MNKPIHGYDLINQLLEKEGMPLINHFQIDVLEDFHQYKTIVWHRKAGKTTMALVELLKQSQVRIGTYWIVFPFLDEGRDTVWNNLLGKIFTDIHVEKRNENLMMLKLRNGSHIRIKGADHPEALRGPNVCGIICDEFSRMRPETWAILQPMIQATKGFAWFISTPASKKQI